MICSFLVPDPFKSFMIGLGVQLIMDERCQDHPFAIGKKYFKQSSIVGIILVAVFLICLSGGI